jgi:uncharacterized membrane protein
MVIGWHAVSMSAGLFLIYLPFSPSSLIWPHEWAMVVGWVTFGAILYFLRRTVTSE